MAGLVGADQIHIFTLQPVSSELHTNRGIVIQQSPQQQQQMLQQQEIDGNYLKQGSLSTNIHDINLLYHRFVVYHSFK